MTEQLEQLCTLVLRDAPLQDSLRQWDDLELFIARVVEEGGRRGLILSADQIRAAIRANRQALTLRRVVR